FDAVSRNRDTTCESDVVFRHQPGDLQFLAVEISTSADGGIGREFQRISVLDIGDRFILAALVIVEIEAGYGCHRLLLLNRPGPAKRGHVNPCRYDALKGLYAGSRVLTWKQSSIINRDPCSEFARLNSSKQGVKSETALRRTRTRRAQ